MGVKSNWQKKIEKRTDNIGFISRLNAFREPTQAEKAAALIKEIESWQSTRGVKPYSISAEYSIPQGHGFNLKQDTQKPNNNHIKSAIEAYMHTPMGLEMDTSTYENPLTLLQRIIRQIKIYAPQAIIVSTMLLMLYFILREKR